MKYLAIFLLPMLVGCEKQVVCTVTPPASLEQKNGGAVDVGADLTALAKIPVKGNIKLGLDKAIKATFQKVPEKVAACQMLFQTIACATENKNGELAAQLAASVRPICSGQDDPNVLSVGHKEALYKEYRRNVEELEEVTGNIRMLYHFIAISEESLRMGKQKMDDPVTSESLRRKIAAGDIDLIQKIDSYRTRIAEQESRKERLENRQSELTLTIDTGKK